MLSIFSLLLETLLYQIIYLYILISGDILIAKRVLVTFTQEQWAIIKKIRVDIGGGDANTVRTIVILWLIEKGYLLNEEKINKVEEL